jgi:hypothetical protein
MVQISGLGSVHTLAAPGWLMTEAHALSKATTAKRVDSEIFCFIILIDLSHTLYNLELHYGPE